MNILLFSLPYIVLQLLKRQSIARSLSASLAIIPLFLILPLPLYSVLLIFSILNTLYIKSFKTPLNLKILKNIKHLPSLKDSLKQHISIPFISLCLLSAILYPFFLKTPPLYSLLFLPFLFLCPKDLLPYPFYLLTLPFSKISKTSNTQIPTPQNECFTKPNPNFPLEKITTSFSGKKLFSLPTYTPSQKPHIIFLYLESFRSTSLSVAPHFLKLSQEGIYFSNFHANASQTFKAVFATLYGLPPCFGSDFTESSSPVLTLPLNGLPDLLKSEGYQNIFLKAGSHQFDNQGKFLKNHNFDHTFDKEDIKQSIPQSYGTSWGVHDEFMYTYLEGLIKNAESPLFLNAATLTNHHPFFYPDNFTPSHGNTAFEKTMEYTDHALNNFINSLKTTGAPIHLYILGDHGYPITQNREIEFTRSLDTNITHVPFLILPINCGKFTPQEIKDTSSQIDILPTLMDIYNLKGKNSSIGSSLLRKRSNPQALLLNEAVLPLSGIVTNNSYKTFQTLIPLYNTLKELYKSKSISSSKSFLKTLDLSSSAITHKELNDLLNKNPNLKNLYLNDTMLIASLDLNFPQTLKKIQLNNNLLITDEDIQNLPISLQSISIKGCNNLTDQSLNHLSQCNLAELALNGSQFSQAAIEKLLYASNLSKLDLEDTPPLSPQCFNHPLEEVVLKNPSNITDQTLKALCSKNLNLFLCDDCSLLTDECSQHLKKTSLEVLHLENAFKLSDITINHITHLPIHAFYISRARALTKSSIDKLLKPSLRKLFCIDCDNLPQHLDETDGKEICLLKEGGG
ncbi:MAG: Phosphoglycerol transferase I [Chlamydiia bacterium]|nr:Phosphoglycerol transferase I [Chlamydiia bacterium]